MLPICAEWGARNTLRGGIAAFSSDGPMNRSRDGNPGEPSCGQGRSPYDPTGAPHARYSEQERLDQRQNAGRHHCCIRSRTCHPHRGTVEHRACCEQSRTERNAGIDDGGSDPAASRRAFRDYHGSGALRRCRHRMVLGTWLGGRAGIAGAGTASCPLALEYRFPIEARERRCAPGSPQHGFDRRYCLGWPVTWRWALPWVWRSPSC
jgi:hypothetical protein